MSLSFLSDLDMSYSTSFRSTARVKYGVDFNSSNIVDITHKLKILKKNMQNGEYKVVHVGLEIGLNDVEHICTLIGQVINAYSSDFSFENPPNIKLQVLTNHIREKNSPDVSEVALKVVKSIMNPSDKKTTRKELKEAKIEQKILEIAMKDMVKAKKK